MSSEQLYGASKDNSLNVSKIMGEIQKGPNQSFHYKGENPHYVVFIEDGVDPNYCKSIKLDLNYFKCKYFIPPPKFISVLPSDYLHVQSKFHKRAYKELLEICAKELTGGLKVFQMMYTLDGEILEILDDLSLDLQLILVSED